MKKTQNIFGILCLIIAIFSSCSKNITDSEDVKEVVNNDYLKKATVFSATLEQSTATKTILQNDGKIYWSPEDSINVFGKNQYKFTSTLKEEAPNTEFITEDNFEEADGQSFVAVYPYSKSNSYDGEAVTLSVPSSQIASLSTFDKNAFVMLAKSDAHTLSFRNLCGGIKVSITADGINRIVFKGNNGEALAGKVKVIFDESGYPVVSEILEKESSVELIAPKDSTFKVGEWYYLSCLPADLSQGYTVEFYKEYSDLVIEASLVSDSPVVVKRSVWGRIKDADIESPYNVIPDRNYILYTTTNGREIEEIGYWADGLYYNRRLIHYYDKQSGYFVLRLIGENTRLPYYVFENTNVVSVVIPSNFTVIGWDAFKNCRSLRNVSLPNSITLIESGAFSGCDSLETINIPDGVKNISESAFSGCRSLTTLEIPRTVTIEKFAFSNCSSLTSISFSDAVSIGSRAFEKCIGLTDICIPDNVSVSDEAFINCSGLKNVTIQNVKTISTTAFNGCSVKNVVCGQYALSLQLMNLFPNSKIQSVQLLDDVTSISRYAFLNCSSLTSITIPNGVTSIEEYAFENCSSLTSITIPNGVTSIEEYAFENCSSLTSITIPPSVTSTGGNVFKDCPNLTNLSVMCEQWHINQCFSNVFSSFYSRITNVQFLGDITHIGDRAFSGCRSLTTLEIPRTVRTIGEYAFSNCSSLTSISFSDAVSIGSRAFEKCIGLTDICIPDNASVSDEAFINCSGLKDVIIRNAKTISTTAFKGCHVWDVVCGQYALSLRLKNLFPDSKILSVRLLDDVTSISRYAFHNCSSLNSIIIPNGVTSIEEYAFGNCSSLISISIPSGVISIGDRAFFSCRSLMSVFVNPITPPNGGSDMFFNNAPDFRIYVPSASLSSYKEAEYWKNYAPSIRPM